MALAYQLTGKADLLDHTVNFLAKRDGIDKTLKIIRYATRIILATSDVGPDWGPKLNEFESSIATSRKAYRLGKFLGNVNAIRKVPLRAPYAALEYVANVGECIYYFVDQFQWLVKVGMLPAHLKPHLTAASAWGELLGYVASITLNLLRIHAILEREVALIAELKRRTKFFRSGEAGDDEKNKPLINEIRLLRARRMLRTLGLAQDVADSLLALADIRAGRRGTGQKPGLLSNAALLALAGLISGLVGAYKHWPGVNR